MSRVKKDDILDEIFTGYKSDFCRSVYKFNEAYKRIREIYSRKLNDLEDLKHERYRLENNKISIESSSNSVYITVLIFVYSVGFTVAETFWKGGEILGLKNKLNFTLNIELSKLEILIKMVGIVWIWIIGLLVAVISYKFVCKGKYTLKVQIYDLAIKVLNDIEKDIEKSKITVNLLDNALAHADNVLNTCNENLKQAQLKMNEIDFSKIKHKK